MKKINELKELSDIKDFYYITTCGKVVSFSNGKQKILKGSKIKGYHVVGLLTKDGGRKNIGVHRIVGFAFIINDDLKNKVQINHIDENRSNNCVGNLEWCTPTENLNHGNRSKRSIETHLSKRDITFYETNSLGRGDFRKRCKAHGWSIEDFEEKFSHFYIRPDGKGRLKMFNYTFVGKNKGTLTANTDMSGSNNPASKPMSHWETNSITSYKFKLVCKRQGWNYEDFEEIFSCRKQTISGLKDFYVYKHKNKQ